MILLYIIFVYFTIGGSVSTLNENYSQEYLLKQNPIILSNNITLVLDSEVNKNSGTPELSDILDTSEILELKKDDLNIEYSLISMYKYVLTYPYICKFRKNVISKIIGGNSDSSGHLGLRDPLYDQC